MNLKHYIHSLVARLTNESLTLLRNRRNLKLSREEFRSSNVSFSQFGEDLLILSYFKNYDHRERKGFYIDVGAFHPFKLSNTTLLYKLGWRGINIDCDQEKIDLFSVLRPDDINICAGVSNSNGIKTLLRYPMSATNRLLDQNLVNKNITEQQLSLCGELPVESLSIRTKTLNEIVIDAKIGNQKIDYLNVDVEGIELEVLQGLDFDRYTPTLISVEIMDSGKQSLITEFLERYGYTISDIVRHNYFFLKR